MEKQSYQSKSSFLAPEAGVRFFLWSKHHRLKNEGVIIKPWKRAENWTVAKYKEPILCKSHKADFQKQVEKSHQKLEQSQWNSSYHFYSDTSRRLSLRNTEMNIAQFKKLFVFTGFLTTTTRLYRNFCTCEPFVLNQSLMLE